MRKVLAVITAILLAAVVFAPAMGYTISAGAKVNYSISSEKVGYSVGSEKVNYSFTSGTPAHENVYNEEMGEHPVTYSISSKAQPYSFKSGANAGYSFKAGTTATNIVALGGQKASEIGSAGELGKGLIVPPEAENKTEAVAPVEPIIDVPVTEVANTTNETVVVTPPVVELTISGKVTDTNMTGLSEWTVNLEMPAGTIFANTTTSDIGEYSFGGLAPGAYVVAEVLMPEWNVVSPADGKQTVDLVDNNMTVDFQNEKIIVVVPQPQGNETMNNATMNNTTQPV